MSKYNVINILDLAQGIGEDALSSVLSDFSCAKNCEIEDFVKRNALEFAKKKLSVTYLAVDDELNVMAIFTLAHKALEIKNNGLSKTTMRKLGRFASLDEDSNAYTVSAFLIAQFGKNDAENTDISISGNELMDASFAVLSQIQHDIGGAIVYLECEEKQKLLDFYCKEPNCFTRFGERYSKKDDTKYIQLFKFL